MAQHLCPGHCNVCGRHCRRTVKQQRPLCPQCKQHTIGPRNRHRGVCWFCWLKEPHLCSHCQKRIAIPGNELCRKCYDLR